MWQDVELGIIHMSAEKFVIHIQLNNRITPDIYLKIQTNLLYTPTNFTV